MKRRKRLAKILTCLVLSLFLISFSLPVSAAMLDDDASIVYNSRQPISYKGWLAPVHNTTGTLDSYQDSFWTGSMSGSSSSYLWRLTNYFDTPINETLLNPRTIIGWEYDSTLDFNVDYVYQFNIQIRYDGSSSSVPLADFSKVLLCFSSNSILFNTHTFNNATAVQYLKNSFAPASYTISGSYVELVYNIPIYPSTMFSDIDTLIDDGIEYIPISGLFIWNQGAGDISFTVAPSGTFQRYQTIVFPRNNMPAKIFTPDQWSSHVEEQGFSDLSDKIDQQTGEIVSAIDNQTEEITDSIDNAVDQILNPPVPTPSVDSLIDAHQVEEDFSNSIKSTLSFSSVQSSLDMSQMLVGINSGALWLRSWLNVAFQNPLINLVVNACLGFALIYMFYRSWL